MQNAKFTITIKYWIVIVNCALYIVNWLEFSHYEFYDVVAVGKDEEGKKEEHTYVRCNFHETVAWFATCNHFVDKH